MNHRIPTVRRITIPAVTGLLATAGLASALPGDVLRAGPTRSVTSIAAAVAAVGQGDVVLVDPATYVEDVLVTEGVAVVVDGGSATLEGRLTVTGIPPGQQVLIAGLDVAPPQGAATCRPDPAATITTCRGAVHFQDCRITGPLGFGFCPGPGNGATGDGGHAVSVDSAFDLVLQDCALVGGIGAFGQAGLFSPPGGTGGDGLRIAGDSQVTLSSSTSTGGVGGFSSAGGFGGTGVLLGAAVPGDASTLFAFGSTIRGGEGGGTLDLFQGSGGPGLVAASLEAIARLQDTDLFGGQVGSGGFIPGSPGLPFVGSTGPVFLVGTPCTLVAPNRVEDGQSWEIRAESVGAGGEASLLVAFQAAFRFAPAFERPLLVRWPAPGALRYDAVAADATGSVAYAFGPTPPPTGEDALIVWLQMICVDASGGTRFSEARAVVLLGAGV
ncbi:MAG: hypothetical protein AAGB93_22240 [Planctomycetota bacterium]